MKKELATLSQEAANMESRLNAEVSSLPCTSQYAALLEGALCPEICVALCNQHLMQYLLAVGP